MSHAQQWMSLDLRDSRQSGMDIAAIAPDLCSTAASVLEAPMAHRLLAFRTFPDPGIRRPIMTVERPRAIDDIMTRVQGEFLEMPGLRLTEPQARRLWGLDAASCDALLGALIDAKFLVRTREGAFMRIEHAVPVKANVRPRQSIAVA
jgi:hypothetical protein